MKTHNEKSSISALAYGLSGLLVIVTLIAMAASFFVADIFARDNPALAGCARGTALVLMVVAVPVLIISMFLASRGSLRAVITWLGAVLYIFYNSFYYAFGASANQLFLLYVAMMSLGLWTLVELIRHLDINAVKAAFTVKTPVRVLAVVLLVPALLFVMTDFLPSITSMINNTVPPTTVGAQTPTNPFFVVDLALLVPLFALAAFLQWKRQAWGYVLAGIMLTFYVIELLGIGVDQHFGGLADPTSTLADASAMPMFFVLALVFLVPLAIYLWNIKKDQNTNTT